MSTSVSNTRMLKQPERISGLSQQRPYYSYVDREFPLRLLKLLACSLLLMFVLFISDTVSAQASAKDNDVSALFKSFTAKNNQVNVLRALLAGKLDASTPLNHFYTEEHLTEYRKLQQAYLTQAEAFSKQQLSPQTQVNLDVFIEQRKNLLNELDRPAYELAIWQSHDYLSSLFFISSGHGRLSFNTINDYEQWLERLQQFPELLHMLEASFRKDLSGGVIAPDIMVNRLIATLMTNAPQSIENSVFYQPVTNMPAYFTANQKQYIILRYSKVIKQSVYPAVNKLKTLLVDEYLVESQKVQSVTSTEQGKSWYQSKLKTYMGAGHKPDDLHESAHSSIKQIKQRLLILQKESGQDGELSKFIEQMNDKAYFFQYADELMQNYRQSMHQINKQTPTLFSDFPKATYQLTTIDDLMAAKSPALYYQLNHIEGLMIGSLKINSARLLLHPKWQVKASLLKYGAPGYHFLHAMHEELNKLPPFRDDLDTRAFELGWGLYAASLGDELNIYTSWKDRLGWLLLDLKATLLLAVDTGIHTKGWSVNDAKDYLMQHGFFTEQQASKITHKIMLRPGFWSAEKTGFVTITTLKQQAIKQLGDLFEPKYFHQQLLQRGRLPLTIVETQMNEWIERTMQSAASNN